MNQTESKNLIVVANDIRWIKAMQATNATQMAKVIEHLSTLNGKTGRNTTWIAVFKWVFPVIIACILALAGCIIF